LHPISVEGKTKKHPQFYWLLKTYKTAGLDIYMKIWYYKVLSSPKKDVYYYMTLFLGTYAAYAHSIVFFIYHFSLKPTISILLRSIIETLLLV